MALNRTFPYCKTPLDVPSGVRRRRTLNKLPQAAGNTRKLLARTAPHNPRYCSEDNLLVVSSGQHCCGQYPRHGEVFNRGNRITTPGVNPAARSTVAVTVRTTLNKASMVHLWSAVRMPMDSLKKNRQTGAVPDSIRESRYQSRMRPENSGEGTIQNPPAWLSNGTGRKGLAAPIAG